MSLARTPEPPYYAAIFTSRRAVDHEGYAAMADRMVELAEQQPGYLGMESVREGAVGITVSYWDSVDAIDAWRRRETLGGDVRTVDAPVAFDCAT